MFKNRLNHFSETNLDLIVTVLLKIHKELRQSETGGDTQGEVSAVLSL